MCSEGYIYFIHFIPYFFRLNKLYVLHFSYSDFLFSRLNVNLEATEQIFPPVFSIRTFFFLFQALFKIFMFHIKKICYTKKYALTKIYMLHRHNMSMNKLTVLICLLFCKYQKSLVNVKLKLKQYVKAAVCFICLASSISPTYFALVTRSRLERNINKNSYKTYKNPIQF